MAWHRHAQAQLHAATSPYAPRIGLKPKIILKYIYCAKTYNPLARFAAYNASQKLKPQLTRFFGDPIALLACRAAANRANMLKQV